MLTELQVKNLKPRNKKYMLRDSRGLYLRVDPSGRKYWILRYHENKKERQISLWPYPVLSLKNAREKCAEIQSKQAQGESPSIYKGNAPKNRKRELCRHCEACKNHNRSSIPLCNRKRIGRVRAYICFNRRIKTAKS